MRNPWRRPAPGPQPSDRLLGVLTASTEYRARLDAALDILRDLSGLPDAYLYVAEPGGRRFHLEHTKARPAADPSRMAPGPMQVAMEGGAEWSVPTPPFEISRIEEDAAPRTVTSPVGRLCSLPVLSGSGDLMGLLRLGPFPGEDVPKSLIDDYAAIAASVALVIGQSRREEDLRQRLASATAQVEASRKLAGSAVDVERLIALLLDLALAGTRIEAGFVAVRTEDRRLEVRAAAGMPDGFADDVDLTPGTGLFDWSAAEGGALFLRDFETAERMGIHSLLAVPLMEAGDPLGVFALVTFTEGADFDEHDLALLEAFSEQIRLMLYNAQLFGSFTERYLTTVEGLATALDARRPDTRGHHHTVSAVAEAIAREAGLDEAQAEAVRVAGLIHDVGLAGSAEGSWEADVEHPTVGASLVAHLPLHPGVSGAVATHHEWFDGWGFPAGLSGEEIPRTGRVLAVAEFLVELTTPDAIRPGWPREKLATELSQRSGSQFDPVMADAAGRLLAHDTLPLPAAASQTQEA
ncbi:MAG: metal-dependent phosphohydrolase sub domain protein [Solirubrobacteraceae bacterium]|nr:metal-dependent phosphohydrolase sub domain protein [Solirubrobacteraceae bacterium]